MKKNLDLNYGVSPNLVAMVTSGDYENANIATIAWTGILNSEPMIIYIAVRKCRYTNEIITATGEFVINLPSQNLVKEADFCGSKTGRAIDKFEECHLTKGKTERVYSAYIEECKINLECKIREVREYPSHDVFIADVVNVMADEELIDENGMIDFQKANLITYAGGKYFSNNSKIGHRGMGVGK